MRHDPTQDELKDKLQQVESAERRQVLQARWDFGEAVRAALTHAGGIAETLTYRNLRTLRDLLDGEIAAYWQTWNRLREEGNRAHHDDESLPHPVTYRSEVDAAIKTLANL